MKSEIEFSWVAQEALKGTSVLNAINIWPWSHIGCEGGWGRNAHYPLWCTLGSMAGLADLTREGVIENPLFTPFRNETERMSSTNLFAVTDAAATPQLRARFLADAIPAESHAAGANALDVRANIVNTRMDQDVRDGGYMSNYDRWPGNRRETVNETERLLWHHSDFKIACKSNPYVSVASVCMFYYLNPTSLDRNLEWDLEHNLCPNPGEVGRSVGVRQP